MAGPAYQTPMSPSQDDAAPARSAATSGLGAVYAAVAETHSAVVFFAGDRAYKLKKPVALGFLDFSRARARAVACRREVTLNRRFAPDVYLGVAAVHGLDGRVCDHLVVMRRMPAARRLSVLVRAGADVQRPVRQVARVLAAWHAAAPRSGRIAAQGTPEALWRRWEASIETALAGTLAARLGRTVLSSDRIRKELVGVPAEQPCPAPWQAGIYTPAWTSRIYQELLRRAGRLLARGESVIADATWESPGHRAGAATLAGACHTGLVALRCATSGDIVERRLAARSGDISDAGPAVARQMAARQVPWQKR